MKKKITQQIQINNKNILKQKTNTPKIPLKRIQSIIRLSGIQINGDYFIIISFIISLLLGIVGYFIYPMLSIMLPLLFLLIEYILLSINRNKRLLCVYDQLELFINKCSHVNYIHIVDLISNIYGDFTGSFRDDLESCYIESKRTGNKDIALVHFKEKYDIAYLNFCIDTLQLVKGKKDINIPTDFLEYQTKSKVALIKETTNYFMNTKIDICITGLCCGLIITLMSFIFKFNIMSFIMNGIGFPLTIITILVFLWGLFTTYQE